MKCKDTGFIEMPFMLGFSVGLICQLCESFDNRESKKETKEKKFKFEEGKFYMGSGSFVYKLKNDKYYYFTAEDIGWIESIRARSCFETAAWKEVENPEKQENIMSEVELSFEDALNGMKAGKCYKMPKKPGIFSLKYGLLFIYKGNGEWDCSDESVINSFLGRKFIEVEDPDKKVVVKKGNRLGLSEDDLWPDECGNNLHHFDVYSESSKIAAKWDEALKTLMELKAHRLTVKAEDGKSQLCIINGRDNVSLNISTFDSEYFKLRMISPFFNTREDAKKAIKDIGEEAIIEMMKVMQGMYE